MQNIYGLFGVVIFFLGLIFIIKPEWGIFLELRLEPFTPYKKSKGDKTIIRIFGTILILAGLFFLYLGFV